MMHSIWRPGELYVFTLPHFANITDLSTTHRSATISIWLIPRKGQEMIMLQCVSAKHFQSVDVCQRLRIENIQLTDRARFFLPKLRWRPDRLDGLLL